MIQSTTYMDSVAKGELVPQITLNALENPEEEWTLLEIGEIVAKMTKQWFHFGDGKHNGVITNYTMSLLYLSLIFSCFIGICIII